MKGVVFDEFIHMVEERFSLEMTDKIIGASHLATGGAYTSVGTYDHRELIELAEHLGSETGQPAPDIFRMFGIFLFKRFGTLYPNYFGQHASTFALLGSLDGQIHVEVKKLYPDAELPRFDHQFISSDVMEMTYRSKRPFADLAEGLILGCIEYFHEHVDLMRKDLPCEEGTYTLFILTRRANGGGY